MCHYDVLKTFFQKLDPHRFFYNVQSLPLPVLFNNSVKGVHEGDWRRTNPA